MLYSNLNLIFKKLPLAIMVFFLIDIGFCIVYIVNNLIGNPFNILTRLFDLDSESSLSTWYSSTQYFCIFILSAIFSYYQIKRNTKLLLLLALPAIFLLMSADEIVQIHEWLGIKSDFLFSMGNRRKTLFPMTGIWMFSIGLPFLAFFLLFTHSLKKFIPDKQSSLKKLVIGMIIMLSGALGFELLSNFIEIRFWFVEVVFEEGLEMIGATVMLWAVYDMVIDCYQFQEQKSM